MYSALSSPGSSGGWSVIDGALQDRRRSERGGVGIGYRDALGHRERAHLDRVAVVDVHDNAVVEDLPTPRARIALGPRGLDDHGAGDVAGVPRQRLVNVDDVVGAREPGELLPDRAVPQLTDRQQDRKSVGEGK